MRPRRAATPGSGPEQPRGCSCGFHTGCSFTKNPLHCTSSSPNLLQPVRKINDAFWTFQMQKGLEACFFFCTLSFSPFSAKKKLAEVRTHNGQACVTDQLPPTPRPVDKSSFVHCILGGTPGSAQALQGNVPPTSSPNRSHGSGSRPGPSCANPRPDKNQRKRT